MKLLLKLITLKITILALSLSLFTLGCRNTAEGVKEDASNNAASMKEANDKAAASMKEASDKASASTKDAAEKMASATEKAGKNTADALTLTPKIKKAITDDTMLNNTANLINVESSNDSVTLTGYVQTEKMKNHASEVAKKAILEAGATNTLTNELKIKP
jgi:osmotically-inducible protein OsmY